jgi:hypothetical protein
MSSGNLQKVKILYGNDMYPSIDPKETLYLDSEKAPEIGDVVLFENRFGMKIPHRLMHKAWGYYFTRGDNCQWFNYPFKKDKLMGVIVDRNVPVIKSRVGEFFLALFLPYFIFYCRLFDIKKKKKFLPLKFASLFYPHLPPVEEMNQNGRLL